MLKKVSIELIVISAAIITSVVASSASVPPITTITEDNSSGSSWFGPEFSVLQKVYDDCQNKNDFTGCLKGKALVALSKAADQV